MLGQNGTGANFRAQNAPLVNPVTGEQTTQAYNNAQTGLQQQQAFLQALQAQNGLGNQASVFNQLQGVANGTGPNPAAAQLAQATGNNTANQAALMAGQRGAGQNVGLIARQAAQQGGANQQNAAGQAASLQASQSLNAMGQLSGIANQQVANQQNAVAGYSQAAQNEQQNLLNSVAQYNNAAVGNTSSQNSANGSLANTIVGGQFGLAGGAAKGASGGAAAGATGGKVGASHIGNNPRMYADGGQVAPGSTNNGPGFVEQHILGGMQSNAPSNQAPAPQSSGNKFQFAQTAQGGGQQVGESINSGLMAAGKGLYNMFKGPGDQSPSDAAMSGGYAGRSDMAGPSAQNMDDAGAATMAMAKGGKVDAMLSPGEKYLNPREVKAAEQGRDPLSMGKKVPGKAKVKGDSLKNDTVPAKLEEGGIVLPRHVMESKNPHWEAHKFVSAILAKEGRLPARKSKRG